jgi:hypothetical protein
MKFDSSALCDHPREEETTGYERGMSVFVVLIVQSFGILGMLYMALCCMFFCAVVLISRSFF